MDISTHAPRTGSDYTPRSRTPSCKYFNPRSPHGERRIKDCKFYNIGEFQPTLPARGATAAQSVTRDRHCISTHAPRTGSDICSGQYTAPDSQFQPTLPARGATFAPGTGGHHEAISTHAPRTGSDDFMDVIGQVADISTHAPRTGSDVFDRRAQRTGKTFQPTLPARGATT